ncbi:cytosolic sulfotransferase 12-like [Arachis duranensis]|uniref:Sulfotransferase n=1 Tax=Arachis duranensis TaxID=130453 RepID=A0A6P4CMK2_ARADU|nr:cytosolic sulfotransferase 12-like [Arachis duranensis]XP_052117434.1 cytosolic sulfotransferase 12-like [Arachis duranensis]
MAEGQPSSIIVPKYLQEDELSEDVRDLISTLPTDKGWFVNTIYQYQGFWHVPRQLQGLLNCQKHFKAQDTDILLATQPKSGTTWLKALTFSLINRKTKYPITLNHDHPLFSNNPHALVPFLEFDLFHVKDVVPDLSLFSSPRLFATHLPYVSLPESVKDSDCKIVYLCRDPKDTFISLWHFSNSLRLFKGTNPLKDSFDQFCRGINVGGPFWDHILSYWKESLLSLEKPKKKVMFLRYEELKMNTSFILKNLAEFLGCPFSKEEEDQGLVDDILKLCSFENLKNLEVNKNGKRPSGIANKAYFRRGEIGDWKNHLTHEMVDQLNTIVENKMGNFGFKF